MSGRPPILFPLFGELGGLKGVGPRTVQHLEQLGVATPRDLLFTLPHSGIDRKLRDSVADAAAGEVVTVRVLMLGHMPPQRKGRPYRVAVRDERVEFTLVWFHAREPHLRKQLPEGEFRVVSGKVEVFDGGVQIVHPDHVVPVAEAATIPEFEPIYPLTAGLTQRAMTGAVTEALARAPDLPEWIDPALRARRGWPDWRAALTRAHAPQDIGGLSPSFPARERLAYDEFLAHQLTLLLARSRARRSRGISTSGDGRLRAKALAAFAFAPTEAQRRASAEIAEDMASDRRMHRLLQGDVGSGKTLVAFLALLTAVEVGGQGVLMAPTEILARQHQETLAPMAEAVGVRLDLLTGRDTGAARQRKLEALASGETGILIGTHAVFQQDVAFHDLRVAVIDEQHRFGVRQRLELGQKGAAVDVLVVTATPIPRSLALANYGDMDLSVLDQKPPGRKPVRTALVSAARLDEVIAHLRTALDEGRQAYWVCPLVEESETVEMTSAEDRFKRLRREFGEDHVALVHGQMPPDQKDGAMARFVSGAARILVATTVIEVGVNVPNASIMVIEHAENFGLAQLHQLRGRVGRGSAESTCLLLYHPPLSETAMRRLKLLRETEDGFRIAEEDLLMRGAGDLIGTAQSGLPRFRIADVETQSALLATAHSDARALVATDPKLEGQRGQAARTLLWLHEKDQALKLLDVG